MRSFSKALIYSVLGATLLSACGSRNPVPVAQGQFAAPAFQRFSQQRGQDLVAVRGFKTGDRLKVKGPFWTKGDGKVHGLTSDTFDIEFKIATYHLRVQATRLNDKQVRFVTQDIKNNRTVEAVGNYTQNGGVTVFDMGKGQEVEKLTVYDKGMGAFHADVVQGGRLLGSDVASPEGKTTLKFSKG